MERLEWARAARMLDFVLGGVGGHGIVVAGCGEIGRSDRPEARVDRRDLG